MQHKVLTIHVLSSQPNCEVGESKMLELPGSKQKQPQGDAEVSSVLQTRCSQERELFLWSMRLLVWMESCDDKVTQPRPPGLAWMTDSCKYLSKMCPLPISYYKCLRVQNAPPQYTKRSLFTKQNFSNRVTKITIRLTAALLHPSTQ